MKRQKHFFITGTNTEVGKTIVTRAMVAALTRRGRAVRAVKPVESGAPEVDGTLRPEDAAALANACGSSGNLQDVCACAFRTPVSPHLAARIEGRTIDAAHILQFLRNTEEHAELVIAEGAGGLLVPLSEDVLYADLIAQSGYQLIIVAPNVLGTINATLLSIEAARSRGIPVAGVVLNGTPETELDNAESIARFGGVPILGSFPTADTLEDARLAQLAEETLDLTIFN